jgi:hypothetical protein
MPRSTTNNTTPVNLTKLAHWKQTMQHYDGGQNGASAQVSGAVARPLDEDCAETEAVCPGLFPSHRQTGSQLM